MKIILWFLGVLAIFFVMWVWGGGPERAEREGVSPILNQPINVTPGNSSPNNTPTSPSPTPTTPTNTNTGGEIQVTPV